MKIRINNLVVVRLKYKLVKLKTQSLNRNKILGYRLKTIHPQFTKIKQSKLTSHRNLWKIRTLLRPDMLKRSQNHKKQIRCKRKRAITNKRY